MVASEIIGKLIVNVKIRVDEKRSAIGVHSECDPLFETSKSDPFFEKSGSKKVDHFQIF